MENNAVEKQVVGATCESCAFKDCLERGSPPIHLEQKMRNENTALIVE